MGWTSVWALLIGCAGVTPSDTSEDSSGDSGPETDSNDTSDTETGETDDTDPEDAQGAAFISAMYLDLSVIERISRFRSGYGHDFSDEFEDCRSMKHYFCMQGCLTNDTTPWSENTIYSPVSGTISSMFEEQSFGTQMYLEPDDHPDFRVRLFHVTPEPGLELGDHVTPGQVLGHHVSSQTMSDLAVESFANDEYRMVSMFDVLTPDLRAELEDFGIPFDELQISAEERDADPLECNGEQFVDEGNLPNWVDLVNAN